MCITSYFANKVYVKNSDDAKKERNNFNIGSI